MEGTGARAARARSRSRARPGLLGAALLALLLSAACSGPGAPDPAAAPASPSPTLTGPVVAQQWFAARAEALRQGVANIAPFYDQDVVLDHTAIGETPVHGRAAAVELVNLAWHPASWTRTAAEAVYVSAGGALVVERVRDKSVGANGLLPGSIATLHRMSSDGTASETLALAATNIWQLSRNHVRQGSRGEQTMEVAERHLATWSAADDGAATDLYAPRARVFDTLLGIDLQGHADITEALTLPVSDGGLRDASLRMMAGAETGATYAAGPWGDEEPIDHLILLAAVPPGDALGVELRLDGAGRIIEERRYHRVDTLLRWSNPPAGWWDGLSIPDPVPQIHTGSEQFGSSTVEVYNGTPGLAAIIPWAAQRFAAAGLVAPEISAITFQSPWADLCAGINGQILGGDVTLCYQARTGCEDPECSTHRVFAKETLLHELSHAWIDQNVDSDARRDFLEGSGQPTWDSTKHNWADRGCELAASTIAWALIDEPYPLNPRLGRWTCAELSDLYAILTGSPPDPMPPDCEGES